MQRFERIISILLFLRAGGRLTAGDMAERLKVSQRTIYRDLDLLAQLGVPLYTERGRNGGIRLLPGYFLPPVTFTSDEAMSLVAGLALLGSLGALPFAADLDTARRKLLAAVPDDLRATLADAERILGFETPPEDIFHPELENSEPPGPKPDLSAIISTFAAGIFQRRVVHLRYHSPYRPATSEIQVTPLGLFWDRNRWYLVGDPLGRDRSQFRADRVLRISLGGRAEHPAAFDIRMLLGRAWLREAMADWATLPPVIRVRITATQRARLQRDWYYVHARYNDLQDGDAIMTITEEDRTGVFELLRWLGPDAELLEPTEWRAAFRAQVLAMAQRYDPQQPDGD